MKTSPKTLNLTVFGVPAPQGSKRHVGGGILVESSKKVKPWREAVKWAVVEAGNPSIDGAVFVQLEFYLPRPKGHYGTGRNAGTIKPSSPERPAVRPDIDKLTRSTLDGLTDAGVIVDDSRIVSMWLGKHYADDGVPRCDVMIWEAS